MTGYMEPRDPRRPYSPAHGGQGSRKRQRNTHDERRDRSRQLQEAPAGPSWARTTYQQPTTASQGSSQSGSYRSLPGAEQEGRHTPPSGPPPQINLDSPRWDAEVEDVIQGADQQSRRRKGRRGKRGKRKVRQTQRVSSPAHGACGEDAPRPLIGAEWISPRILAPRVAPESDGERLALWTAPIGSVPSEQSPSVVPKPPAASGGSAFTEPTTGVSLRRRVRGQRFQTIEVGRYEHTRSLTAPFRPRPGEGQIGPAFVCPPNLVGVQPENPPWSINLDEDRPGDEQWWPLRARQLNVYVPYYGIVPPVTEASETQTVLFHHIDVFVVHLFGRIYRMPWLSDADTTHMTPSDPTYLEWRRCYGQLTNSWANRANPKDRKQDERSRELRRAARDAQRHWDDILSTAATTYILRWANQNSDFRDLLLRLPGRGSTSFRASTSVLGGRYGRVLREAQQLLAGGFAGSAGAGFRDFIVGDSHLAQLNWYDEGDQRFSGVISDFRVLGVSGANAQSICWLTQASVDPTTQYVAWFVGFNNTEVAPPDKKDDRPPHMKELAPRRYRADGRPQLQSAPQVVADIIYPARLLRSLFPTLKGIFLFEIPPRFDFQGNLRIIRRPYEPLYMDEVNHQTLKINALLRQIVWEEPRIDVLGVFDRLWDPRYYWNGVRYNLHMDPAELYHAIEVKLEHVRGLGMIVGRDEAPPDEDAGAQ